MGVIGAELYYNTYFGPKWSYNRLLAGNFATGFGPKLAL